MTKVDFLPNQEKPKDRYKITNWQEYNSGLKRRGSLTLWVDESISGSWYHQGPIKRGGQRIYSAACIVLLLTLKVTFRLPFRQLEGFAESVFALMGAKGASEIIFKREIDAADDPAAKLAEKEKMYADTFANPYRAAARGFVDEVINPRETRRKLIKAYAMLEHKTVQRPRRKHGNIPL